MKLTGNTILITGRAPGSAEGWLFDSMSWETKCIFAEEEKKN